MNSIKLAILLLMNLICEADLRVESSDGRWGLDERRSIEKGESSILEAERESAQKLPTLRSKRRYAKDFSRNKSKLPRRNKVSGIFFLLPIADFF
uniref:Uncharacterized protein n=1 Tax=Parascaris univalens TaxID=6257 RepID=A0A915AVS4_PARUN